MQSSTGLVAQEKDDAWERAVLTIRAGNPAAAPWDAIYGPLRSGAVDDLMVVAQIGQSLDGRIATPTGHSHYINGSDGLDHLHRLRALVDAVVVGVGTAIADDPQLTVRRVNGPQPARVVIDPKGRLAGSARCLSHDGVRRIVVTSEATNLRPAADVEVIALPRASALLEPAAILASLAACGLRRILVEGGARTISGFLAAGCLDRLHIVVAPVILGAGPAGLALPAIERVEDGIRPRTRAHRLGDEVLFDCDLAAQRRLIGCAKMST
jgi:riboflavin-specific deaminase-like protein